VVACHNDPYCDWARVVGFARDWGSDLIDAGTTAGHLNAESGLGHWPFGLDVLHQMQAQTRFPVHAQGQKLADDTPTPLLLTPEG
jgi:predicted alpha/beta hydrolase family esterase